jgi:signal transduction histidine kinase
VPPPDPPVPAPPAVPSDAPVLAAAVLAATSRGHLDATLRDIVQAAVTHLGARYGVLGVLSPDGRRLDGVVRSGAAVADGAGGGPLRDGRTTGHAPAEPDGRHPDGRHLTEIPVNHPGTQSHLRIPVRLGTALLGNLYLTDKCDGGFTLPDIEVAKALAAVAGLAIENPRLAASAGKAQRWGQAATELATALLSGAGPDEVLRSVCTRVAALTGADLAGVLAPGLGDGDSLTVVAAVGPGADDLEGVRLPVVGTHVGEGFRTGAPRRFDDISHTPVSSGQARVSTEILEEFGPALLVPLGSCPPSGLLVTVRARGSEPFEPEDLDLLSAFATHASVVLQLARAQQRERALQVQADRDRIARDLHDHVVQRIYATALSLDRLSRSLEATAPDAAQRLARSVDDLDHTIAEIRAAIFELHLEETGSPTSLRQQLTDLVRQITEGSGLRRDVRTRGGVEELPRELVPDLLAVVRELVTNVVRHAAASRVTVTVSVDDDVRVVVTDDGRGLRPGVRSGLANLAARAERRGGRLTAAGRRSGTQVFWTVPLVLPRA